MQSLPDLLYLGDVPVEASYHGAALLYRLLQNYPPEKLRVIEGSLQSSERERRLPLVGYQSLRFGRKRLLQTRFHRLVESWLSLRAGALARRVSRAIPDSFTPQAVLTVAHGYLWLTAAAFAAKRNLPLHLIVHDDWPRIVQLFCPLSDWLDREFGRVYRQAASRLCVSPFMVDEYERRYSVTGTVMYPSRARDIPQFDSPPERIKTNGKPFTVAFAGTLNTLDYLRQLSVLAKLLSDLHGRLLLFGPNRASTISVAGIMNANVMLGGLLPSRELVQRLRADADVLFLPTSFAPDDAGPMALNFPSKLTDYTATGLPLLIWGPEGGSAVKWAQENAGVAVVVTEPGEHALGHALTQLAEDPGYRWQLGLAAMEVGERYFAAERAVALFHSVLRCGRLSG